jgi:hypothetical protein
MGGKPCASVWRRLRNAADERCWMSIGPTHQSVRANQKMGHRSTPDWSCARASISSASATRPTASISKGTFVGEACASGRAQSVQSRGMANEPRSAWRRLNVSTPETRRTFRTTNRCPRSGWNGWMTSADPKGWLDPGAVRWGCAHGRRQDRPGGGQTLSRADPGTDLPDDSHGYRPGRSAIDALRQTRQRCWRFDWVLDIDVQSYFDSIDWELLLKAALLHG